MPIKIVKSSRGHKRGKTSGWGSRHSDHERMGRTPPRKFAGATRHNTRRENRLEELGRVDAEKAYTSRGKRNLREEKDRIRSELKTGGRAATRPMTPDQKRKPRKGAGPSAGGRRKKFKTHGGGPDSGNIGKLKDAISKLKDKGLGRSPKSSLDDLRKKFKRREKGKMIPLRKGGSAKGPNRPRPTGPHMWVRGDKRKKYASGGVVMAGKKVGCQIK